MNHPTPDIEREITKALPAYHVRQEKDNEILKALQNASVEAEEKSHDQLYHFNFLTFFTMNFKKFTSALVAVVLIFGGTVYYRQNSYAYHLNKAKDALAELQDALNGNVKLSWIPKAQAQEEGAVLTVETETTAEVTAEPATDVDADGKGDTLTTDGKGGLVVIEEEVVAELSAEVVAETETAIEIAEELGSLEETAEALESVSEVQEETVEVLVAATDVLETEVAMEAVADALTTTVEQQIAVDAAAEAVETAIETGTEVTVEVATSTDVATETATETETEVVTENEAVTNAKALITDLRESGASDAQLAKFEKKLALIERAVAEGKEGRLKGLTNAMEAQSKHLFKKAEKAEKKAADDSDEDTSDDEDSDEAADTSDDDAAVTTDSDTTEDATEAADDSDAATATSEESDEDGDDDTEEKAAKEKSPKDTKDAKEKDSGRKQ